MRRGVRGQDLVFPLRFHDQRLFYALVQLFSSVIFTNSSQNKATIFSPLTHFCSLPHVLRAAVFTVAGVV